MIDAINTMATPTAETRVLLIIPVLDERERIADVVWSAPRDVVDGVLVVDDGSRDGSAERAREAGAVVISHASTRGVGAAIRSGIEWARDRGFGIA